MKMNRRLLSAGVAAFPIPIIFATTFMEIFEKALPFVFNFGKTKFRTGLIIFAIIFERPLLSEIFKRPDQKQNTPAIWIMTVTAFSAPENTAEIVWSSLPLTQANISEIIIIKGKIKFIKTHPFRICILWNLLFYSFDSSESALICISSILHCNSFNSSIMSVSLLNSSKYIFL